MRWLSCNQQNWSWGAEGLWQAVSRMRKRSSTAMNGSSWPAPETACLREPEPIAYGPIRRFETRKEIGGEYVHEQQQGHKE